MTSSNLFPVDPARIRGVGKLLLEMNTQDDELFSNETDYVFPMNTVRKVLGDEYLNFLKTSGYAPNIDTAQGYRISKGMLKIDDDVRRVLKDKSLQTTIEQKTGYVTTMTHTTGKTLVESLGDRLPTVALMRKLFIPYIKQQAQAGNTEAQTTLDDMVNEKAEWNEDIILQKKVLKIGNEKVKLTKLPQTDGSFNLEDLDVYGYPTTLTKNGEYHYWSPKQNEVASIRDRYPELFLDLNGAPSYAVEGIVVRRAKFF